MLRWKWLYLSIWCSFSISWCSSVPPCRYFNSFPTIYNDCKISHKCMHIIIYIYRNIQLYIIIMLWWLKHMSLLLPIYFFFFVFPFNSKDTETLVTTVTVADLSSCWYVPLLFSCSVISDPVPVYSSVDSSWIFLALPKVWFRELVISSAFTLALWTARRQACLLHVKKKKREKKHVLRRQCRDTNRNIKKVGQYGGRHW